MKKILMLGANFFQVSAIKRAKELGYRVITADYLPKNPGHQYADESYNVSTVEKEAILALSRRLQIDGILSYASDVSAPTAAYVAEKLGLPTNPYESVKILTQKNLFREFMDRNQLRMPGGKSFQSRRQAQDYFDSLTLPVMVKPIDASGSKGVVKVSERADFGEAYREAMSYSISRKIIIEKFIQKKGYQIDGDGFIRDGKIVFFGVMDQHNNLLCNPYAPIGLSCPSVQDGGYQKEARALIGGIFEKLHMRFGAFNFEYIIGGDGEIYILEIGPRNGGNFIPDTIKYARDVDMIEASIRACVGDEYGESLVAGKQRIASSYVVHSMKSGVFRELKIHEKVKPHIRKKEIYVKKGQRVNAFRNGKDSIGAMVIEFDSVEQMKEMMDKMWEYVEVIVEE